LTRRTKDRAPEALTEEELGEADGEALPERHAMSVIRGVEPLPHPFVIEPAPGYSVPEDPPAAS